MSVSNPGEEFAAAIAAKLGAQLDQIHVSMPGRIETYDREKQKANVQPLVRRMIRDESGELKSERYPVLTDVPVEFFGGGDYSLTFPVARGMTCRLDFCSAALDKFLAVGGEVDPKDGRRFSLSDAVCVLGLRDFAHAIKDLPADAWVLACPTSAQIRLGAHDASEKSILGDAFKAAHTSLINEVVNALNAIVPGSGASVATALMTFNGIPWLSSIVRLK